MEFFACVIGGAALIFCGFGLFMIRPPDWRTDSEPAEQSKTTTRWLVFQRSVRYLNNGLLAVIGGGIVATAFIPHGKVWVLLWTAILVLLLVCIIFAMIDALTSLAGYRRALPEAARRSFGNDESS